MTNIVDIKLAKDANGEYDIELTQDGDIAFVTSFETAILMSLLCERRADESEVSQPNKRRGWWGNQFYQESDTFEMGSKVWLYSQSRLTQNISNFVADAANESLQWLVGLLFIQKVQASTEIINKNLVVNVNLVRFNVIESYSYILWENTKNIG